MAVDFSVELRNAYLRAAQSSIEAEESRIAVYRDFFSGIQAIQLTDRQQDYLTKDPTALANICRRTVNIPKERLEIQTDGIAATEDAGQSYSDAVSEWWHAAGMQSKQKDVYEATLRDGITAVIVGWDERSEQPTFTPNLVYDGETGLVRFHFDSDDNLLFASKRWTLWNPLKPAELGTRRMTVYRPDAIERYQADNKSAGGWRFLLPEELDGLPNPQPWVDSDGEPLGIPVIPFENPGGSELADVVTLQELLNHNISTFDISVDFHGFPINWAAGIELPIDTTTGKSKLPDWGPSTGLLLKENGRAGRLEAPDLIKLFQGGVVSWFQILAIVKGWPIFMFDRSAQIPSGVALQIAEGSLVKQVEDKQSIFSDAWRRCFDMARKIYRLQGGDELEGEIEFNWISPKTNDELAHIEALEKKFEAGQIPLLQRWRELGYSLDQINEMIRYRQQEDSFGLTAAEFEINQ